MTTTLFDIFPEDEKEDFYSACKKYKLNPKDFSIKAEIFNDQTVMHPINRTIILTFLPKTIVRNYYGGHISSWTYAFEAEAKVGVFD